ncbi:chemotaxis protein CheC [Halanaerobiaceae bacterium Z-7014]|uniref:Chemotaxis protein CheC n=1 Tax=Halonatronomonas betaini TaxID=2778430 RepID=A0A931AUE3_9FIRM|nr:chemotaxis protein CheC [Halonatronomonas betaini]MBF8436685.1 chemotaxis protein CheC [Halonatronomonas betaini]
MTEDIFRDLDEMQKDALREIGNIGAGNAATAFSQFLNRKIDMTVPSVEIMPISDVPEITGNIEEIVAGILLEVMGEAPASILFMIDKDSVEKLVGLVTDQEVNFDELDDIEISAVKEIGNIISGSYLNALNKMTNYNMIQSVPECAIDMAGAILSSSMIPLSKSSDHALLIKTQFIDGEEKIEGYFFLIPETGSLKKILEAIGFDLG